MIADRIKLARRKAGFSLRDLSDAMDNRVTAQAIGKYERGEDIPSSGVLSALAKTLGVSLAYLLDNQGLQLTGVEFRTKANTSGKDRALVETEVLEWIERYLQVELVLELDSAHWHCPIPERQQLRDANDAEHLAIEVRKAWKLGLDPIPNMTELLEENGSCYCKERRQFRQRHSDCRFSAHTRTFKKRGSTGTRKTSQTDSNHISIT